MFCQPFRTTVRKYLIHNLMFSETLGVVRGRKSISKMTENFSAKSSPSRHLCNTSNNSVKIEVSKTQSLMDEDVEIKITGLGVGDKVTVLATTKQDSVYFWSHGNFLANQDGCVNLATDKPLVGSYKDVDPMGLFWSLKVAPWQPKGQRMYTLKAVEPLLYRISVFPVTVDPSEHIANDKGCLASTEHYRSYNARGVKRVPVKHDKLQGTVFIPEGKGPFPGIIDMFGGMVTLMESRAALLASYGFVTFALSYVHGKGLPQKLMFLDTGYFEKAVEWFTSQPYVQSQGINHGIGALGLCLGGTVALWMTENMPQVRATVNLNGLPFPFVTWSHNGEFNYTQTGAVNQKLIWTTDEGIVMKDAFYCQSQYYYKPWQHGAKLMTCLSGDDFMTRMDYNMQLYHQVPEQYRSNMKLKYYPGAGHLIEPPYTPCVRSLEVKHRMNGLGFCPEELLDEKVMLGGYPEQHAAAQKDCWFSCIKFFKENLTLTDHDQHIYTPKL